MKINPRDINLDSGERYILKQALTTLIHIQRGRLKYLTQSESIDVAENTIALAQDLHIKLAGDQP